MRTLIALTSLTCAGCFAIADLDRFGDPCSSGNPRSVRTFDGLLTFDLEWLTGAADRLRLDPDEASRLELRLWSVDGNQLDARAVIENLDFGERPTTVPVRLPRAMLPGPHQLDFFIDGNDNGEFDPPAGDRDDAAWRRPVECASGLFEYDVSERHGGSATLSDISDPAPTNRGEDFSFHLRGMTAHGSQQFELRVIDERSERVVGYYRTLVDTVDFEIFLPGIVEPGIEYRIDYYADLSANWQYDAPPIDHAWRDRVTATDDGIELEFNHNTDFTDVEF